MSRYSKELLFVTNEYEDTDRCELYFIRDLETGEIRIASNVYETDSLGQEYTSATSVDFITTEEADQLAEWIAETKTDPAPTNERR